MNDQIVEITLDGKTHQGRYGLNGHEITVRYRGAMTTRSLGSPPPGIAARLILTELVKLDMSAHAA